MQHYFGPGIAIAVGLYLMAAGSGVPLWPKFLRRRVWVIVLSIFILLSGGSAFYSVSLGPQYPAEYLAKNLRASMNPPLRIDETLRIDSITSDKNTVIYNVTLSSQGKDIKTLTSTLRDDLQQNGCKSADYQEIFQANGTVQILFHDEGGTVVETLSITPQDCEKK